MNVCWYRDLLVCPDCLHEEFQLGRECQTCGFQAATPRDLRASTYAHRPPVIVPASAPADAESNLRRLNTSKPTALAAVPVAGRDSREFLALLKERVAGDAAVLDLGCGPRDQEPPITALGWRYLGIDYSGDAADLLADAHALPFRDQSFDVVFSFAVLEHLHTPARALAEIARILKPGGLYIGSVSQGEPFHGSYFHFTPWGLIALLSQREDVELLRLWPSEDTLRSLATMGRYPRTVRSLIGIVDRLHVLAPWLAPRRMRWAKKDKELDALFRAGSLCFLVERTKNPMPH